MKHIFSRLVSCLLAVLILMSLMTLGASAAERLDTKRSCTLNMVLKQPGGQDPLVGAEVWLYPIANIRYEVVNPDNQILSLRYPYSKNQQIQDAQVWRGIHSEEEYREKLPVSLLMEIIENAEAENNKYLWVFKSNPSDKNGMVTITHPRMTSGLYLVVLKNAVALNCMMDPFLVTLPRKVDGQYDYSGKEVFKPKTEVTEEVVDITVRKVWKGDEDQKKSRPVSITVELMNNGLRADQAKLTARNGWTYTFKNKPADIAWKVQERKVNGYKGEVGEMKQVGNNFEVTIINTKDGTLVQTGELKWPVPVLLVAGSLLMLGGFTLCQSRKKFEN